MLESAVKKNMLKIFTGGLNRKCLKTELDAAQRRLEKLIKNENPTPEESIIITDTQREIFKLEVKSKEILNPFCAENVK